eukprot:m.15721 g.15721  ORF g.15721 m.15721 type:complete len:513 (-) comp6720_c0_seq1:311-1849(-)
MSQSPPTSSSSPVTPHVPPTATKEPTAEESEPPRKAWYKNPVLHTKAPTDGFWYSRAGYVRTLHVFAHCCGSTAGPLMPPSETKGLESCSQQLLKLSKWHTGTLTFHRQCRTKARQASPIATWSCCGCSAFVHGPQVLKLDTTNGCTPQAELISSSPGRPWIASVPQSAQSQVKDIGEDDGNAQSGDELSDSGCATNDATCLGHSPTQAVAQTVTQSPSVDKQHRIPILPHPRADEMLTRQKLLQCLTSKDVVEAEMETRKMIHQSATEKVSSSPTTAENQLTEHLLKHWCDSTFPHAVACEWDYVHQRSDSGRGDLVFASKPIRKDTSSVSSSADDSTDCLSAEASVVGGVGGGIAAHEPCQVLAVEVKHLTMAAGKSAKRTAQRKKVSEQAPASILAWKALFPEDTVVGVAVTGTKQSYIVHATWLLMPRDVSPKQVDGGLLRLGLAPLKDACSSVSSPFLMSHASDLERDECHDDDVADNQQPHQPLLADAVAAEDDGQPMQKNPKKAS